MALQLWLENGSLRTGMTVDEATPAADLIDGLLARSMLPRIGPDGRLARYEVVLLRTGSVISRSALPVSALVEDGDVFRLQAAQAQAGEPAGQPAAAHPRHRRSSPGFSLTAVWPETLNFFTQYPVLAIRATCTQTGRSRIGLKRGRMSDAAVLFNGRLIFTKETCFLIADQDGRFRWVSPHQASQYRPGLAETSPPEPAGRQRLTHYSLEQETEENTDMIYPVRPFSITDISLDGFTPTKEYPVLAIDVDKYLPEGEMEEGVELPGSQQPESVAFFLVGDDKGEFAWVGEDQCRLAPLKD